MNEHCQRKHRYTRSIDAPEFAASNGSMTRRSSCRSMLNSQGSKLLFALAVFGGAVAWAADSVPLDVKTGEWEYTVTTQMTGLPQSAQHQMPSIPPEQLAKMPLEQRARVEAALKQAGAMASGKPTTTTSKSCIRKEDLAKMIPSTSR